MSAISFSRYVRIVSGVIGAGGTANRDLILRLFTSDPRVSPDEVLEFNTYADVSAYFGAESPEAKRAKFYFGWVSPNITTARKLSFARSVPNAVAPSVYGGDVDTLNDIKALGTTASLQMNIAGIPYNLTGLDVQTSVSSYSDVATVISTAMHALSSDPMMATATVTYNAVSAAFEFVGGVVGAGAITVTDGALAAAIGWLLPDALMIAGAAARSPTESVLIADGVSNNYCSALFTDTLTLADHMSVARALTAISDTTYLYLVPCLEADAEAWGAAMVNIPGVALGLITGQELDFNDMVPGVQAAAADYSTVNATSSYMYREFDLPFSVTDDTLANQMDKARVNYYGKTQRAGRVFGFYQRAVLMGPLTAPTDQNVYVNEVWLKDYAAVQFMDLLRALPELPANETGRTYGMSTLQGIVDRALDNGVISPGKTLTVTQRAAVTTLSGDSTAWRQVQANGYWMSVNITSRVLESGLTEYTLTYLLIYGKKDTIRSVEGRHQLV